jgi:hypothetical protein
MSHDTPVPPRFADLGLSEPVMRAVADYAASVQQALASR